MEAILNKYAFGVLQNI